MCADSALTVSLVSLGCPKNLVDSEKILALLGEAGCVVGAPMQDADVIVVNTCGFLAAARSEALEVIAEALEYKQTGRARRVVVAGCLVNRDGEEIYNLAGDIDAIVGVNNRGDVPAAVMGERKVTKIDACGSAAVVDDAGRFRLTPRHTAYLRVSEGCSRRCTFCTVPDIRGPFRSKSPEAVLREARELIADGAVELNVIGQDTTSYGTDTNTGSLAELLRSLNALDGVRWIRLLYAYPARVTDALLDAIAQCEHVVPYVDMPLQHAAGPVLLRMGRGGNRRQIETLLDNVRARIAAVAVRTTFIVGFPGERDEDFEELLSLVRGFRFDAMGVFEFSPEEDTPAAAMEGQVPDAVKAERARTLMFAQQEIAFAANRRAVGRSVEVLADGADISGRCVGRTFGQAPDIDGVCILTEPRPAGAFVPCTVVDWHEYDLIVRPQ